MKLLKPKFQYRFIFNFFLVFTVVILAGSCHDHDQPQPDQNKQKQHQRKGSSRSQNVPFVVSPNSQICFDSSLWTSQLQQFLDNSDDSSVNSLHYLPMLPPIGSKASFVEIKYSDFLSILPTNYTSLKFIPESKLGDTYLRLSCVAMNGGATTGSKKYLGVGGIDSRPTSGYNPESQVLTLSRAQVEIIKSASATLNINNATDYLVLNPLSILFVNDFYDTYNLSFWKAVFITGQRQQVPVGVVLNPSPPF